MTLAVFAYVVMPGLALIVAGAGYAVIRFTDPGKVPELKTAGVVVDHTSP